MRKNCRILFAAIALLLLAAPTAAFSPYQRGPSTAEERAQALDFAESLEKEPLARGAKDKRSWFVRFLIEVPDISLTVCPLIPDLLEHKKNYSSELVVQGMISSGAFLIRDPEKAKDQVAVNQAGIEGTLRAYEGILKQEPKARWQALDNLLALREKGELSAWVKQSTATECSSK
jgi:hypothetical protein